MDDSIKDPEKAGAKSAEQSGRSLARRVAAVLLASTLGSILVLGPVFVALNRRALWVDYWAWSYADRASAEPGADLSEEDLDFYGKLAASAAERAEHEVRYPAPSEQYREIPYPMGDVPDGEGVCTDLVVRAYRGVGADLQRLIHEDMSEHFRSYPPLWLMASPDTNIDHRRVPNMMVFFHRHGETLPISDEPGDYGAGEVVAWELGPGITHIGIVSAGRDQVTGRPLMVHNIGAGPVIEDMLFDYKIIGRFRYRAGPG